MWSVSYRYGSVSQAVMVKQMGFCLGSKTQLLAQAASTIVFKLKFVIAFEQAGSSSVWKAIVSALGLIQFGEDDAGE